MSTVSADHRLDTASAPGWTGLSTREECAALAQAITIRARVKLAQAYASLYEGWVAEDQARRAPAVADGARGRPGEPDTAELSASSSPAAQGSPRTPRKFWSRLTRRRRSMF
jgi:hypothetical protein